MGHRPMLPLCDLWQAAVVTSFRLVVMVFMYCTGRWARTRTSAQVEKWGNYRANTFYFLVDINIPNAIKLMYNILILSILKSVKNESRNNPTRIKIKILAPYLKNFDSLRKICFV